MLLPEAVGIPGGAPSRSCSSNLCRGSAVRLALQKQLEEKTDR